MVERHKIIGVDKKMLLIIDATADGGARVIIDELNIDMNLVPGDTINLRLVPENGDSSQAAAHTESDTWNNAPDEPYEDPWGASGAADAARADGDAAPFERFGADADFIVGADGMDDPADADADQDGKPDRNG